MICFIAMGTGDLLYRGSCFTGHCVSTDSAPSLLRSPHKVRLVTGPGHGAENVILSVSPSASSVCL